MLTVIFVEQFGGAIHTGSGYVTYVVPGVLLLCTGFGSALTAVSVCQDTSGGIVDRLRAMNVHGAALLGGHVIASILRNAVSTVIVIVRRRRARLPPPLPISSSGSQQQACC